MSDPTEKKYDLSIVIACYNEEPHLETSIKEINEVMKRTNYTYELIFIDDCSQDKTRDIITGICQNNTNTRYYFHKSNVGRGGTVKEGLLMAYGKYAGFLDIDLEVHARYIPSMVRALEEKADVATASRAYDVLHNWKTIRSFLSIIYRSIVKYYLGVNIIDTETGYKFFNKKTMDKIIQQTKNDAWFWDTEIMALSYYNKKKINEIPCLFLRRPDKQTTVKLFRDITRYLIAIKKFKKDYRKGSYGRFNV